MKSTNGSGTVQESRAAPRFPVHWPVKLDNGHGKTRNISASGMYVESDARVEPGSVVEFSVLLPRRRETAEVLRCVGRAVRVESLVAGYGLAISLSSFRFAAVGQA